MIVLRALSKNERALAFSRPYGVDLGPYLEVVREMEGGVAYALPLNGVSARSVRVRLTRAAGQLGLELHWAKVPKDAPELIVELS